MKVGAELAGFDLFRPLIIGLIAAAVVVLAAWGAAMKTAMSSERKMSPLTAVDAGTAWSSSDSWVTNITAVASLLAATWTQFGTGLAPLVPARADPAILILFISFGATAGIAPVIYASCTKRSNIDESINQGTVAGYVLAAFATLFAVGGEMTALGMLTVKAISTDSARDILIGFLVAGAAFVALYSWRTMYDVLTLDVVIGAPAIAGAAPAAGTAAVAEVRSRLLVPASRRSATL